MTYIVSHYVGMKKYATFINNFLFSDFLLKVIENYLVKFGISQ